MTTPALCQVGADIRTRHDWNPHGIYRRCGAKRRAGGLTLSQEEVAALVASHPSVIGRLHAKPGEQLSVTVENGFWSVEKNSP